MPLKKLRQLAEQIGTETDPTKLARLIAEWIEQLKDYQAVLDQEQSQDRRNGDS